MLNTYKITFTEDRVNYKTLVIPANTLVDAYIEIQMRYPNAEITEAKEKGKWAQGVARYFLVNATIDEVCAFVSYLEEDEREELVKAIWTEWHNRKAKYTKAV